jgi:hypothetical protein
MKADAQFEPTASAAGEAQEWELCPHCIAQNTPGRNFCRDCGSPLSPYAAICPWERIFAEGHIYRTAAERPHRFIVLLGIWLIFGPMTLVGVFLAAGMRTRPGLFSPNDLAGWLLALSLVVLSISIIFKTTRNYIRMRTNGNQETVKIGSGGEA